MSDNYDALRGSVKEQCSEAALAVRCPNVLTIYGSPTEILCLKRFSRGSLEIARLDGVVGLMS